MKKREDILQFPTLVLSRSGSTGIFSGHAATPCKKCYVRIYRRLENQSQGILTLFRSQKIISRVQVGKEVLEVEAGDSWCIPGGSEHSVIE